MDHQLYLGIDVIDRGISKSIYMKVAPPGRYMFTCNGNDSFDFPEAISDTDLMRPISKSSKHAVTSIQFKVVNQLLCGVHIAVAGEALALAESLGLDPAQCHEVLNQGAAQSFMFQDRGARMVAGEFDEVKSALNIFVKDMGLVTDAARAASQPVPLASAAEQLYVRGTKMGLGLKDDSVVTRVV